MSYSKIKPMLLGTPVVLLGIFLIASCTTGQKRGTPAPAPATTSMTTPAEPVVSSRLVPGPNDPRIAYVTARLMEQFHYTLRPLDTEMSKRFFDSYVDSLDPRHEDFLQTDLDEFSIYRTNLDKLTTGGEGAADLTPAFAIYKRYLQRLEEHDAYAQSLIKQDRFKFNTDDWIALDRRHSPFPKNMEEAEKLWAQQLKFEYLQDKLTKELVGPNGQVLTNGQVTKLTKAQTTTILDGLSHHYDWNLHNYTNWDGTDVLQAYLNGLTHAYDPHSDYFNPEHAQDFSITMNLSLFGIGAQLMEDDGYCTINRLVPGGPAEKSKKLHEKDRIMAVAQGTNAPVDVVDMDLGKVVQMIRGPKATEVRLTISPDSDRALRKVVSLVRDEIKLDDQAAKAKLIDLPDAKGGTTRLGVIDLPSFYAPVPTGDTDGQATPRFTSVDVAKLVNKLKDEGVDGIILDIRSNPGGSLDEAVKLTGLFITNGPVVLARAPDGSVNIDADTDPGILYSGPLAVMINRYSASASEIAAAALQDYDRALIVGDSSSFGKGTVQSLNSLDRLVWPATPTATNNPGVVKITIRKFYRVSGGSTQFKGVVPDIILPDPLDHQPDIESEATLDNPLPWDTIPSSTYTKFNMVQQYVPILSKLSSVRVATNQDFNYIRDDIAELEKMHSDKGITLNEHDAIKERQDNQIRLRAREAERASRPPVPIKIYDITLADADKPGLPAPSYYPGVLETNFDDPTTITFKPAISDSGTNYSADDKAVAAGMGLNLATGTFKNGLNSETNFVSTTVSADKNERATITINTFANSTVTVSKGTVKVKNLPDLDPLLTETTKIMQDYIALMSQSNTLTKN